MDNIHLIKKYVMAKKEKTKKKAQRYTNHITEKLRTEQHKPHQKQGVI